MSPVVKKCRAKDISKCPYHGAVTAEGMYQSFIREQMGRNSSTSIPITAALKSSLAWKGEIPTWWDAYKNQTMNDAELPNTPELLDVIDSPEGKLAVVWQKNSQESQDRNMTLESGMNVNICYFKSFETGEKVGYIKLSAMNDEAMEHSFGKDEFSPFRYQARYSGKRYHFYERNGDRNLTGEGLQEKRREIWLDAMRAQGVGVRNAENVYVEARNLTKEHIPDDSTVAKDLKKFSTEFSKEINNARKYFKIPFVDFSSVNSSVSGAGYGTSLYVYAARRLGVQGQVLRGSGTQTDEAKNLWAKLKKNFPQNVSTVKLTYSRTYSQAVKTFPIFDFRK